MKKIRSLFAALLCFALVFSFAACKKNTKGGYLSYWEEYSTVAGTGDNTNSSGDNSGGGTGNKSGSTSGGGTVNIGTATNEAFLKSLHGLKINIYTQQGEKPVRGTAAGDRYFAILNKIANKYNVTINYISELISDSALQTSILSGKPQANVIGIQDIMVASWLNAGVAADLNSAMKETGITFEESWYSQDVRKLSNLNNVQYAFNADIYDPYMLIYNKRMVQEASITDPSVLYKDGKWTFDKLSEYLLKLKKTSQDGTVLVKGMTVSTPVQLMTGLIAMNNGSVVEVSKGAMSFNANSNAKKAMEYMGKWYKTDKTVYSEGIWTQAFDDFSKGKSAMVYGSKYAFDNMNSNGMSDAVGVVPFPYGPNSSASSDYKYSQTFFHIIPKSEQANATKILFVMNEVYKEMYSARDDSFADSYRVLIRDTAAYNTFKDFSVGKKKMDFDLTFISGTLYDESSTLFHLAADLAGGTAVETVVNTYSSTANSSLNDLWGKWEITGK